MLRNQVLILGSKPGSRLPDTKVDEIFSANGAAERSRIYKQRYNNIPSTAVVEAKEFLKNAVKKKEARPFKVAKGINMMVVDSITGNKATFGSKKTIIESYKMGNEKLKKKQFSGINDGLNTSNILRFY